MTLDVPPAQVETDRLRLRPFRAEDRGQYAAYHRRPDVYRYLYAPVPDERALDAQFAGVLAARFAEDGDVLRFAVAGKEDGAVIGEVLLKMASRHALQGEVGYLFHPDFAGRGYATEAVAALLCVGFDGIGFHRIFARLDAENAGSVGVVERLGFRREAHLVQNDRFEDRWGDEYIYALLRSEWRDRARAAGQGRGGPG